MTDNHPAPRTMVASAPSLGLAISQKNAAELVTYHHRNYVYEAC